jgi:hypothetical protein
MAGRIDNSREASSSSESCPGGLLLYVDAGERSREQLSINHMNLSFWCGATEI